MRKLIILLAMASALMLAGCRLGQTAEGPAIGSDGSSIRGSGKKASRDLTVESFTALDIDSAFEVQVTGGDGFKVTVTADDNLLDYVRVTESEGTLRITMDSSGFTSFSSTGQKATITMPALDAVRLSGASRLTMAGLAPVAVFTANLDGASRLDGDVQAGEIRLESKGASECELRGSGDSLSLTAGGASHADLSRLAVQTARVTLAGASDATVNAAANLDYDLEEASDLRYSGNPVIGQSRVESGSSASPK